MIRAKAIKRKISLRHKRKRKVRGKIFGVSTRPRVSIFKSNKYFYAQVIDDSKGRTLCSADSRSLKVNVNKESVVAVASDLATKIQAINCSEVVFDRNGYLYHGVVQSFVDALRDNGIKL